MKDHEKRYSGRITQEPSGGDDPWRRLVKDRYTLASLFCRDKKVLDSCCGTGWATIEYISPKASSVLGFDLCEELDERTDMPLNCDLIRMDATRIDLNGQRFDIILALDSIEHFSPGDAEKYLSGLAGVCSDEGLVVGTTPLVISNGLKPLFMEWNRYHRYMYTREDLDRELKKRFSDFALFELYNPVCPYFVFICSVAGNRIPRKARELIEDHISNNRDVYRKAWVHRHLFWASRLARKARFGPAFRTFLRMFRKREYPYT
ncbi:MAG: methyltransferase domain-containing protein [Candidatus Omnitrophica bacterium]|nr:methyltransferase domain-containing protein [Candidatus Omnitrophota bacterium]